MATDVLTLGPVEFVNFSVPEGMPFGGKQRVKRHLLLGGARVIDTMGADIDTRSFSGTYFGDDALSSMLTIDAMRVAGQPVMLAWGAEARLVVVTDFTFDVKRFPQYITYSCTCLIADNNDAASGSSGSVDDLTSSDADDAQSTVSTNSSISSASGVGPPSNFPGQP